MCTYQVATPSSNCGNITTVGLTNQERNLILNLHNENRRRVARGGETRGLNGSQPPARSMPDLVWNYELANIAQRWANQCNFGYDRCRDTGNYEVGQNIAASYAEGNEAPGTIQEIVQGWYNEVAVYDPKSLDRFTSMTNVRGENIGNYTQMIWARTIALGCGRVHYNRDGTRYNYLICNYGPSGNFLGHSVYRIRR